MSVAFAPPATQPASVEAIFDGELDDADKWRASAPLFVAGARGVDLFFELQAPQRAAATIIAPKLEWYVETNPVERAGWYQETTAEESAGKTVYRLHLRYLGDLERDAEFPEEEFSFRQHVHVEVNARLFHVVFRGWCGQGGKFRLLAIASR